jgi:hypothetical protein
MRRSDHFYVMHLFFAYFFLVTFSWFIVDYFFFVIISYLSVCRCLQAAVGVALQAFMVGVVFAKVQVRKDILRWMFNCFYGHNSQL